MTAKPKPPRTCPECRYDGGIHYTVPEDGGEIVATRCPNYRAAELLEQAHKLTEEANEHEKEAARRIVADAAETRWEFSANDLREEIASARITSSGAMGRAFTWAKDEGLIVKAGRRVMSNEDSTRHEIDVWRSLRYRGSAA